MQMQLHALNGLDETIAALKVEAAGYRAQIPAILNTLPQLQQDIKTNAYRCMRIRQDGEASRAQVTRQCDTSRVYGALAKARATAMMLEQRADLIEGSIVSLTLQAQLQKQAAAARAPAPVAAPKPAPVAAPTVAPAIAPPPAPVLVTAPVSVAPPVTVTEPEPAPSGRMTKASAAAPQVPEAPLPVTLPPISRMQPAAATAPGAPVSQPAPASDLQKLLPWALAAGAAFLFMNKPKRKRRYG